MQVLLSNLNGVAWLYSTIGLIFSIISAFVIQNQWNRWTQLEISVKGEVDSLWELIIFTEQLNQKEKTEITKRIKTYLTNIIAVGWKDVEVGYPSKDVEIALRRLQHSLNATLKKSPEDFEIAVSFFQNITINRNNRLHYSTAHLPHLLYILIIVSTCMVIFLSLFIAVENIFLDFLFTGSIALLGFLVFLVIDDLNNPFRPGSWHITTNVYKVLLKRI